MIAKMVGGRVSLATLRPRDEPERGAARRAVAVAGEFLKQKRHFLVVVYKNRSSW